MDQIVTSKEHVTNKIRGRKKSFFFLFYAFTRCQEEGSTSQDRTKSRISLIIVAHLALSPQVWLGVSVRNGSHELVLKPLVSLPCRGPTARKPVTADVFKQEHSWTQVLLLECSMEGHKL